MNCVTEIIYLQTRKKVLQGKLMSDLYSSEIIELGQSGRKNHFLNFLSIP